MARHLHGSLGRVQPLTVPQIIAAVPPEDIETREAITRMDPERMEARVRALTPYVTRSAIIAGWALLVTLATAAGDAQSVNTYCACAALDLEGIL